MPLLTVDSIEVVYDQAILAVRDISLSVPERGVVALLGANGAGKSTTLKAISKLLRAERGRVVRGRITYQGRDITHAEPAELVRDGLAQVLEGRHCFQHLTVEENLLAGAFVRRPSRSELRTSLETIYAHFPRLKERRRVQAGYTSGGEQQMVAIGRALMSSPKLVLLDEPSMGLAPQVVEEIFEIVKDLNRRTGVSFLLAEQNVRVALRYADYGYLIENGAIASEGPVADLAAGDTAQSFYLGRPI
jgi:branched-chain amino acid transport system ATP-binding protein